MRTKVLAVALPAVLAILVANCGSDESTTVPDRVDADDAAADTRRPWVACPDGGIWRPEYDACAYKVDAVP